MKGITILGSTGSIGVSTLQVLSLHPDRYKIIALTANTNVDGLFEQCLCFQPKFAVLLDFDCAQKLKDRLHAVAPTITVLAGMEGLQQVASLAEVEIVMAAIVGAAGLLPTLAAVRAKKRVLLANKEVLVMAGAFFMEEVRQHRVTLLPVDSEHNALFQCLPQPLVHNAGIRRLILTASGGPFRLLPLDALDNVTPEQACAHPTWEMGHKVTVDSATMMNKGLEVIEAHWLFSMPASLIDVLIHPESIIHSLVEYADGSQLAQLSHPDMRTPIANALAWPERIEAGVAPLHLAKVGNLTFEEASMDRYPCLRLAYEALSQGGTSSAILNAANEVAVQAFLARKLRFTGIWFVIEEVLTKVSSHSATSLDIILNDDASARQIAYEVIESLRIPQ